MRGRSYAREAIEFTLEAEAASTAPPVGGIFARKAQRSLTDDVASISVVHPPSRTVCRER